MLSLMVLLLAQAQTATETGPRTEALVARLRRPVSLAINKDAPLAEALGEVDRSLRRGAAGPTIPTYFDVHGFRRADKSPLFPVTINAEAIPASEAIARILDPLGLAYVVRDGILIISDPGGTRRLGAQADVQAGDGSPSTAELMVRLEKPARLSFPDETPLREVLAHIERVTLERPGGQGIRFLLVQEGLKEAEATLNSAVVIDLDGVPLRSSIRLMLDQLGLACIARNGRLVIHSQRGIEKMTRATK